MNNYLNRMFQLTVLLMISAVWMPSAHADCLNDFQSKYPGSNTDNAASCATCHSTRSPNGANFNPYGAAFSSNGGCGRTPSSFTAIEGLDSDKDAGGFTNLQEITANAQPGWCSGTTSTGSACPNLPSGMPAGILLDPPSAPVNTPPVANANGPYTGVANAAVSFTGTASDGDNDPLTYAWNFGDGGNSTQLSPSHTYVSAGNYTVTFTVNDGTVNSTPSQTTATISAANNAPTANAGGPYGGEAGTPVQFVGSANDSDGDALTYTWNFGDGGSSNILSPTHNYGSAGTYTVSLTVNDGKVNSAASTTTAEITAPPSNTAPTANAGGPYSGQPGQAIVFDGSGSTDSNGIGDIVSYAWTFGDGASASGVSVSHAYAGDGSYTATLTVTDTGELSNSANAAVTIATPPVNQAPVADVGGPYAVDTGVAITFDGTGSSDPEGAGLTYAWNFGDTRSGTGPSPAHTYVTAGTYDLSLTVSDGQLSSNPSLTTVTVTDPAQAPGGEAVYANNCQACHGDPWAGPAYDDMLMGMRRMTGARQCTITASIYGTSVFPGGVPEMQGMQGMIGSLEVAELATYLNSQAVTGEQRYITACAGCHGADGSGGRSQISVLGRGAGATAAAILNANEMGFLACLPDSDVTAIEDFLLAKDVVSPPVAPPPSSGGGGALGWILLLGMLAGRFFPLASRKQ
ncbi:MAG: PKD domain-containing protein [Gammaproteobacteria bacterium]|nr:PKD domain-containing protein [Gammaproteobacteria bacterium]